MKLKEFIEVKDTIYAPILIFKLETNKNIYENDFNSIDANFEPYDKYIKEHQDCDISNISIINYNGWYGLQICLKKLK